MPQLLEALEVSEISLVDAPACASTDPLTGRKIPRARVALYKRDDSREPQPKEKPKMSKFKQVLKSATTRDQIVAAVVKKAAKITKRKGIAPDLAEAKTWAKDGAREAYESAPLPKAPVRERKFFEATPSEAELDRRARKRMKKTGVSYPKACSEELTADPSLYENYQRELAAGNTFSAPEPEYLSTQPGEFDRMMTTKSNGDDDDECPECGEDVDDGAKFCSSCGTDLAKKSKVRRRA